METWIKRASTNHFASKTRKRTAVLAMTGAAVAAAVVLAAPAGASPLAPRTAPAVTGTEHFQIMSTSTTSPTSDVIAWGVFTAPGVDNPISSNSSGTKGVDSFAFPGGKFKVTHTAKSQTQSFNAKTCLFQFTQKGVYALSDGTGKYKGIHGSGTFVVRVIGLGPKLKSGACNPDPNAVSIASQTVIDASGPVKIH
jgi:hypothetical protein